MCSELRKEIPVCRDLYYSNRFNAAKGNLRGEWQLVNSILNKTQAGKKIVAVRDGDVVITDKLGIANTFNNYFSKISLNVHLSLVHFDCSVCNPSCRPCEQSFAFTPVNGLELLKIIGSLKSSNSTGIDGVSNRLLKNIACFLVDVLSHILNYSVFSGVFPDALKSAAILPLHKKGATDEIGNYRPISLLPSISKIFEKAIKSRVVNFLNKTKFFSSAQFGFREGRSTEDALLNFCSQIYSNIDKKKCTAGLFVDITKAFDMVNHDILITKLENAGFRGFTLNWFRSYLKNRNQRVKIDTVRSNLKFLNLGVPKGSVLGPILFLI